jgi:molybdate transport system substrate-binding protein
MALAILALPTSARAGEVPAPQVTVFAAASLSNAMRDIADAFASRTGTRVKTSFAASSALAKQIEAGAQADVIFSADEQWLDYLAARGLLAPGTRRGLLSSRLVLVVPLKATARLDLSSGIQWLAQLPAGRIATGDPAHVPAGRYARQALTSMGAWQDVEPRLARADNVRSALVLVERGEASAGIVYSTDAAASRHVVIAGTFPEPSHDPIVYGAALVQGRDGERARAFLDFLGSAVARDVFERHGFTVR